MHKTMDEPTIVADQQEGFFEERAILRFYAEPDEGTFEEVVRCLSPRMLRYFRAHGAEHVLAEELMQDVLVAVFRHIRSLRDPALFWAWVYKIARNTFLQHHRKSTTEVLSTSLDDIDKEGAVFTTRTDPWQHGSFGLWMRWLEPAEQDVLVLRYVEDLEYHEIAEALHIPIGTVKWRIYQAKKKLSERLPRRKRAAE